MRKYMRDNVEQIGKLCTGCRSCEQTCPQKCITMLQNAEGFLYPSIDKDKCVQCGLCLKKCAQNIKYSSNATPKEFYAFKNNNTAELFHSASGGVSDVAVKVVLLNGGVAFGAAYMDGLEVRHIEISKDSDRSKLQSSKYVQSDTGYCYTQAKDSLEKGKLVLFSGTPCQIDGLNCFLGKDYENLYTIDIICHGVPSPLFFKKYVDYTEEKMNGKLIEYNFRSKENRGWGKHVKERTETKTKIKPLTLDKYGKHFSEGDCYRECCYQCQYADIRKRPGNLTIGDFWGVEKSHPELSSELGVSSVIVNDKKGQILVKLMQNYAEIIPITLSEVLMKQENLIQPTERPAERDTFYKDIFEDEFVENLHVGLALKERIKALLPGELVKMLKRM